MSSELRMNAHYSLADAAVRTGERMVGALRNAACFDHPVRDVEMVETHISWVMLAGPYAYKIKKPLNLGFLDFSSVEARRNYCSEELRLNRRLAPDLYLEVVPITGSIDAPHVEGEGPILDYAVKMRRFDQSALLDAVLARGELDRAMIESLADKIAAFHAAAPDALGTPGIAQADGALPPALANFKQMLPHLESAQDVELLERLQSWTLAEHERPARLLAERLARSRIRECHGDLHLGNVVLLDGGPTPFDCIEFNPALRWMDAMSEVAFMVMDLTFHGRSDLAHIFLDRYLEASGDYSGVPVLPFYLVYRAVVRAKVTLLRATQRGSTAEQRQVKIANCRNYLELADSYTRPRRGAVIITHGLSGSGKTTSTQPLIAELGAVRVRSDVERKRLHGLPPLAHGNSVPGAGVYTGETTSRTYSLLHAHARSIAGAGFPALVDATFLKRSQRAIFRELALSLRVPFVIVSMCAARDVLRDRIAARTTSGGDASEANVAVLEAQFATLEPLGSDELSEAITVDANDDVAAFSPRLNNALKQRLGKPI